MADEKGGDQGSIIPGPRLLPIEATLPVYPIEATEGTWPAPCVGHVNSTVLCEQKGSSGSRITPLPSMWGALLLSSTLRSGEGSQQGGKVVHSWSPVFGPSQTWPCGPA